MSTKSESHITYPESSTPCKQVLTSMKPINSNKPLQKTKDNHSEPTPVHAHKIHNPPISIPESITHIMQAHNSNA